MAIRERRADKMANPARRVGRGSRGGGPQTMPYRKHWSLPDGDVAGGALLATTAPVGLLGAWSRFGRLHGAVTQSLQHQCLLDSSLIPVHGGGVGLRGCTDGLKAMSSDCQETSTCANHLLIFKITVRLRYHSHIHMP